MNINNEVSSSHLSCYYLQLGSYLNGRFAKTITNPPLSDAVVYRDVYYAPPNYQTLTRPVKSVNKHYNYPSIHNAYCACEDCRYGLCVKCPTQSNACMN